MDKPQSTLWARRTSRGISTVGPFKLSVCFFCCGTVTVDGSVPVEPRRVVRNASTRAPWTAGLGPGSEDLRRLVVLAVAVAWKAGVVAGDEALEAVAVAGDKVWEAVVMAGEEALEAVGVVSDSALGAVVVAGDEAFQVVVVPIPGVEAVGADAVAGDEAFGAGMAAAIGISEADEATAVAT